MVRRTLTFFSLFVVMFIVNISPVFAQNRGDACGPGCIWSTHNPATGGPDGGLHCLVQGTANLCTNPDAAPAPAAPAFTDQSQPSGGESSGFSMPSISLPSLSGGGLSDLMPDLGFDGLMSMKSVIAMGVILIIIFLAASMRRR